MQLIWSPVYIGLVHFFLNICEEGCQVLGMAERNEMLFHNN